MNIHQRMISDRIAGLYGIGQVKAYQIFQSILTAMIDELSAGNTLQFRDFGVFRTKYHKSRMLIMGETRKMSRSSMIVKFKQGRVMRESIQRLLPSVEHADVKDYSHDS